MVELLFAKGYIKLLFATETFAVGINMPTKTVIFTDVNKFDGTGMRMLHSHEYTQMAGRAGRRGIDSVGNVIHLNNLFKNIDSVNYKLMMKGDPQKLTSKFKISYNLILNLIDIGDQSFATFAKKSMIQGNIDTDLQKVYYKMSELSAEIDKSNNYIQYLKTPKNIIEEYIDLTNQRVHLINSKRKEVDKKITVLKENYRNIENEQLTIIKYNDKCRQLEELQGQLTKTETYIDSNVDKVVQLLEKWEYITKTDLSFNLSLKGSIATQIREVHCIIFTDLIILNKLNSFSIEELVSIFSCFTNVTVNENLRAVVPSSQNKNVQDIIINIVNAHKQIEDEETALNIYTGTDCHMQFDLIEYSLNWCNCEDITACKRLIQTIEIEKEIFLGEFIKAILKINNISAELEKVAEYMGNIELLHKLKEIPKKTLKYVATNQSLYI